MEPLPIHEALPTIGQAVQNCRRVLVKAPPGSGKTTRIPPYLVDHDIVQGKVVVVEPRRLAARFAARHVSAERGELLGASVGYQVRFESVVSNETRVLYVTEGVFSRQLLANPTLSGVGAVVLDEFHERRLNVDMALGWLLHLQRSTRPDLAILVMSATLDSARLEAFLEPCVLVEAGSSPFDVEVEYENRPDDRALELRIASAIRDMMGRGLDGDVLVFLPGAAEIRKAMEACGSVASKYDLALVGLHGNLGPEDQDRALAPCIQRKVILSTNVAESSVTIDGVVVVIDSGLVRLAAHAPWSGLPTLRIAPISKASAAQRAGRAGRTRPGKCLRLYSQADWFRRPDQEVPEIRRMDLTEAALMLRGLGIPDTAHFPWFEPPEPRAWQAAETLLTDLGALETQGELSEVGHRMLHFPTHPRIGRILVEAERRGVASQAAILGALITERDLALQRRSTLPSREGLPFSQRFSTDLLDSMDQFLEASKARFDIHRLRSMGVDVRAARDVEKQRRHLQSIYRRTVSPPEDIEDQLRICVLTGYPDRVARLVRGRDVTLVGGGTAIVDSGDQEVLPEFLVAVDAEERREGRNRRLVVRSTCRIEPEWLLDLFGGDIEETVEHRWNGERGCVETVERLCYRKMVLDEVGSPGRVTGEVSAILAKEVLSLGIHEFAPEGALEMLLGRVEFVRDACPEKGFPGLEMTDAKAALRDLCEGKRCLAQVREVGLIDVLKGALSWEHRQDLDRMAPERVRLAGGMELRIRYAPGKAPWASSRLQDFFGMVQGPRLADGRVAVVLHLLAPNQRAVQVTRDLEGFWSQHYPKLRSQLCRRYPKHAWPEDGRTARPPAPGRLR